LPASKAGATEPRLSGLLSTINVKTRFFDQVCLAYYLNDNLKLSIGHAYTAGRNALTAGGAWSFAAGSGRMASLFAEARFGEGNNHGVWGGLRIYFGQRDKTLIRRNREDDPVMACAPPLADITSSPSCAGSCL
jgi:hypothetical protein